MGGRDSQRIDPSLTQGRCPNAADCDYQERTASVLNDDGQAGASDRIGRELPREAAREALKAVLEGRMAAEVDRNLEEMAVRGKADRRNGFYPRYLQTEPGRKLINTCWGGLRESAVGA